MSRPLLPLQGYRSPQQVAELLNITREEVHRLIKSGPLEAERAGKHLRIHSSSLQKFQRRKEKRG